MFFSRNPNEQELSILKDRIKKYFSRPGFDKSKLESLDNKTEQAHNIAWLLRDEKIDGWKYAEYKHLKTRTSKMYKALVDLVSGSINKLKLQKSSPKRSSRSVSKADVTSGHQSCNEARNEKDSPLDKLETTEGVDFRTKIQNSNPKDLASMIEML